MLTSAQPAHHRFRGADAQRLILHRRILANHGEEFIFARFSQPKARRFCLRFIQVLNDGLKFRQQPQPGSVALFLVFDGIPQPLTQQLMYDTAVVPFDEALTQHSCHQGQQD